MDEQDADLGVLADSVSRLGMHALEIGTEIETQVPCAATLFDPPAIRRRRYRRRRRRRLPPPSPETLRVPLAPLPTSADL